MHDELERTERKAGVADMRVERLNKTKNDAISGTLTEVTYLLVSVVANQLGRKHVGCRIRNKTSRKCTICSIK